MCFSQHNKTSLKQQKIIKSEYFIKYYLKVHGNKTYPYF